MKRLKILLLGEWQEGSCSSQINFPSIYWSKSITKYGCFWFVKKSSRFILIQNFPPWRWTELSVNERRLVLCPWGDRVTFLSHSPIKREDKIGKQKKIKSSYIVDNIIFINPLFSLIVDIKRLRIWGLGVRVLSPAPFFRPILVSRSLW